MIAHLETCFWSPHGNSTITLSLKQVLLVHMIELKTKTRNALKWIDSLLRVALKELFHPQF